MSPLKSSFLLPPLCKRTFLSRAPLSLHFDQSPTTKFKTLFVALPQIFNHELNSNISHKILFLSFTEIITTLANLSID